MTVSATNRLVAVLLVVAFLISLSIAVDISILTVAMVLLALVLFSRFYVELSTQVLSHLYVESSKTIRNDRSPIEIVYVVRNPTIVPLVIAEYSLQYSPLLRLIDGSRAGIVVVPPMSSIKFRFVFSGRVGVYTVGPLNMVSRDVFGLFKSPTIKICNPFKITIPPAVEVAIVKRLWISTRMTGLARTRLPGEGIEFYDVREYKPGDEPRRIVWRFLASRNRLAVKESERESYQHILFVLDSSRDMWFGPPGQTPAEHCARIAVAIARYLARRGYLLSATVFNEENIVFSGRPSTGSTGFRRVYETLSSIGYVEKEVQIRELHTVFKSIALRLPRERTLLFVFTRIADESRVAVFTEWLKVFEAMGHLPYIVTPIIVSYEAADLPPLAQKLYHVKLYSILKQDLDYINMIRRSGIRVVATRPSDIPQRIVEIVELIHR